MELDKNQGTLLMKNGRNWRPATSLENIIDAVKLYRKTEICLTSFKIDAIL